VIGNVCIGRYKSSKPHSVTGQTTVRAFHSSQEQDKPLSGHSTAAGNRTNHCQGIPQQPGTGQTTVRAFHSSREQDKPLSGHSTAAGNRINHCQGIPQQPGTGQTTVRAFHSSQEQDKQLSGLLIVLFLAAVECPDSGLSCSWLLWNALTVVCPVPGCCGMP
jgi:hypothetical protein